MSDAWRVASIKSFEQVPVGPTTALLRVSASSAFRARPTDGPATLAADDGHQVTRFASLPAPTEGRGVLRCAYSVPVAVVTSETVFSLEFDDGLVIALPHPSAGAARLGRRPGAAARVAAALPAEDGDRRSELAPKLTALTEELATTRHEAVSLREDAEIGRAARGQILHLHLEAVQAHAELQAVRDLTSFAAAVDPGPAAAPDAAATELAAARQAVAEHEQRASEAVTRADAVATELNDERTQHLALRERVAALEADARDTAERVLAAERDRDAALAARREIEASTEPLRAARARAENELLALRDQIRKMTVERDELSRQASAYDGIAVKARERAAEAEREHQNSSGRLAELETWTSELERRLADTTTQLADARAANQFDESELRRLRGELVAVQERSGAPGTAAAPPTPEAAPDAARQTIVDGALAELQRSALADAHRIAERDLTDAVRSAGN